MRKICKHYPCHKDTNEEDFDCLLCYCPLYEAEACGGKYTLIHKKKRSIKDCSDCVLPHTEMGQRFIIRKLLQILDK